VEALERQGHRRLLVLTGEHPKYTFDQFLHVSGGPPGAGGAACKINMLPNRRLQILSVSNVLLMTSCQHVACAARSNWLALPAQALQVINSVKTDPCGNIRRVNVEIPTLSVSDMRRLKATDCVSAAGSWAWNEERIYHMHGASWIACHLRSHTSCGR